MEAEQAVLGGIMLDNAAWLACGDVVKAEHFFRSDHQLIFGAIAALAGDKKPYDPVTVSEILDRRGKLKEVGGLAYLGGLTRDTPGSANVRAYAEIVHSRWKMREASIIAGRLQTDVKDGDSAIDTAVQGLMALNLQSTIHDGLLGDAVAPFVDDLDEMYSSGTLPPGVMSGIGRLDKNLGGFSPGHLIIVAARPSMGKTTFALNVAANNQKLPIGMMSGEQPRSELVRSLIAMKSGVSAHAMRLGKITEADWPKIAEAAKLLRDPPFYVNDSPEPWIDDIERQARKWKHYHDMKLLLSDYLQRQNGPGEKRHEQVEAIVRRHKGLARELNIPVILLCQINRDVEKREDKRPLMSDLRDSGAIEQEADVIVTLYRDEVYYGKDSRNAGKIELGVVKNRHGPLGVVEAKFNGADLTIRDYEFDNGPPEWSDDDLPLGGAPGGNGAHQRPMENRRGPYRRSTPGG